MIPKLILKIKRFNSEKGNAKEKIINKSPYVVKEANQSGTKESLTQRPGIKASPIGEKKFGFGVKVKQNPKLDKSELKFKRPGVSTNIIKAPPLTTKNSEHNRSLNRKKELENSIKEQKELEIKRKQEETKREEKRKMIAEKKLVLKQKLSAIKIQKYWRAR